MHWSTSIFQQTFLFWWRVEWLMGTMASVLGNWERHSTHMPHPMECQRDIIKNSWLDPDEVFGVSLHYWLTIHKMFLYLSLPSSLKSSALPLLIFNFSPLEKSASLKVTLNPPPPPPYTQMLLLHLEYFIFLIRSFVCKPIWKTNIGHLI